MGTEREVAVTLDRDTVLQGKLTVPAGPVGLVVLTEGEGAGQQADALEPLAAALHGQGLATLRLDLLTTHEEAGRRTRSLCFNTGLLAMRLMRVTLWLGRTPQLCHLPQAYLGRGTGADAALKAAALDGRCVRALVAWDAAFPSGTGVASRLHVPTLMLAGRRARGAMEGARSLLARMPGRGELELMPEAAAEALSHAALRAGPWLVRELAAHVEPQRPLVQ